MCPRLSFSQSDVQHSEAYGRSHSALIHMVLQSAELVCSLAAGASTVSQLIGVQF